MLELLLQHDGVDLAYDECVGVTYDDVHADPEAALGTIIPRYHEMEGRCDAVVIVGTDYTDVAGPTELAYNARIAANLGSPSCWWSPALDRSRRTSGSGRRLDAELRAGHAEVVAVVANRCDPAALPASATPLAGAAGCRPGSCPTSRCCPRPRCGSSWRRSTAPPSRATRSCSAARPR